MDGICAIDVAGDIMDADFQTVLLGLFAVRSEEYMMPYKRVYAGALSAANVASVSVPLKYAVSHSHSLFLQIEHFCNFLVEHTLSCFGFFDCLFE